MSKESENRRNTKPLRMDRKNWVANAIAAATRSVDREKAAEAAGLCDGPYGPDRTQFV